MRNKKNKYEKWSYAMHDALDIAKCCEIVCATDVAESMCWSRRSAGHTVAALVRLDVLEFAGVIGRRKYYKVIGKPNPLGGGAA